MARFRETDVNDAATVEGNGQHALFPFSFEATPPTGLYRRYIKRLFDIALVLIMAPVALAVVGLFALLVSLDGHNPFYTQTRIGRNGRKFRIWKLRSMVADADEKLGSYLAGNPEAAEQWARTQKLVPDPRVTRIGQVIRKSSIDELPQLWNVLNGTMSLVGPRPMMAEQQALYPGHHYYRLRPGITGAWQVSERHTSSFAARAVFDDVYERDLSLATDLAILAKTFTVVMRCTGR